MALNGSIPHPLLFPPLPGRQPMHQEVQQLLTAHIRHIQNTSHTRFMLTSLTELVLFVALIYVLFLNNCCVRAARQSGHYRTQLAGLPVEMSLKEPVFFLFIPRSAALQRLG